MTFFLRAPTASDAEFSASVTAPRTRTRALRAVSPWAAVALACALTACGGKSEEAAPAGGGAPKATKVGVIVVQPQDQMLDASLPGRTLAYQRAEVRPQVSGIIQKRLFTEGAMVKQGQPLYQIDATSLQAAQASAQAALAKAEANLKTQEANARRNAELVKITAISQQAYEESQAAATQAKADVAVARANLEIANVNLRYTRIEAPISGRISLSSVTPGALVTANQATALTDIVQTDPMYVDFTQSTADLLRLQQDWKDGRYQKVNGNQMPITITLEDGRVYPHPGKLQFSGLIANPTMGTVTLRAVVPNPEGTLLPGMFVQAQLPTGLAPDAILVPQRAVTRDLTGRPSVLVVKDDGVVEKRNLELGRAVGVNWLLDKGLQPGERVVVDGFQRIKPGDKAEPQEVDLQKASEQKTVDPQAAAAKLRATAPAQ